MGRTIYSMEKYLKTQSLYINKKTWAFGVEEMSGTWFWATESDPEARVLATPFLNEENSIPVHYYSDYERDECIYQHSFARKPVTPIQDLNFYLTKVRVVIATVESVRA